MSTCVCVCACVCTPPPIDSLMKKTETKMVPYFNRSVRFGFPAIFFVAVYYAELGNPIRMIRVTRGRVIRVIGMHSIN